MYLWTDWLGTTWLNKCVKSLASEHPLTSNIINGAIHCWNRKDSTFTIFIDPFEGNSGWKSLFGWHAKSRHCLLTHWLPITSFLLLTDTFYSNIFRCNYLRNETYFLSFFAFCKFTFKFEHFQENVDPHRWRILKLTDSERRCSINI